MIILECSWCWLMKPLTDWKSRIVLLGRLKNFVIILLTLTLMSENFAQKVHNRANVPHRKKPLTIKMMMMIACSLMPKITDLGVTKIQPIKGKIPPWRLVQAFCWHFGVSWLLMASELWILRPATSAKPDLQRWVIIAIKGNYGHYFCNRAHSDFLWYHAIAFDDCTSKHRLA